MCPGRKLCRDDILPAFPRPAAAPAPGFAVSPAFYRLRDVVRICALSRSTIYNIVKAAKASQKRGKRGKYRSREDVTNAIVAAIKSGASTAPEIAKRANIGTQNGTRALRDRQAMGIVKLINGEWVLS